MALIVINPMKYNIFEQEAWTMM